MTHAQHTPAPWHVSGSKVPIVYDANGWAVCNAVVFHGRYSEGQCMDNARLIAAAPDLLAALETAYNQLATWIDSDAWDADDERALELIGAAIAKAKGE